MSEITIPETWAETNVGTVIQLINGYAFKSGEFRDDGVPVIRISNIQDGFVDLTDAKCVNENESYDKFLIMKDDLLVAMSGATTGKMGVYNSDDKSYLNQRVGNLRVIDSKSVNLKYRNYFFKKSSKDILDQAYGGAQPNISGKMIEDLNFPLPPILEQARIADKIETCFAKIDETEQHLTEVEKLLERMSISFLMCDGTWHEGVPLDALTEERVEKIKLKNPDCRKIGVDNDLGVVDLRISGKQNFENYKIVRKGDIFYNPMRINVGSLALYLDDDYAITSPDYIVFRIKEDYSPWLVFKFLKSSFGAEEISKKLTGSVRERLYYKKLKDIVFPNPNVDVHKKANKIIQTINSDIVSKKLHVTQLINLLKDSILSKAFEGRLVDQIESEGTGHQLLEKILAKNQSEKPERKVAKKTAKKVTKKNTKKAK